MSKLMIVEVPSYSCEFKGIREVQELVRCKECRHRYMDADLQVWTCTYGLMIKPDGFCNYGEVRDE